jgi:3(or 17)beta-hydroxysteroid dehydrogenase
MNRLENRVAIVTGGASGLGKATAERLMRDGARVVITDRQAELGHAAARELGCAFLEQDVTNEARWAEVVQDVELHLGRVNVLVNNAGIIGAMDAVNPENTRYSEWKKVFAVNVDGVFLGCRAVIPAMRRAGGGSIVNISSIAALLATPYATAYGASKATVRQLTKSVAQYCAQEKLNVRCNSVHPGDVRTPMWDRHAEEVAKTRGITFEQVLDEARSYYPMSDFTLPEDVAAAVAFLASDDARRITGEQLIVDGGTIHCDTYHKHSRRARHDGVSG